MLNELVLTIINAGEANMTGLPSALQSQLMLPNLWVAELLSFIIILIITMVPIVIFTQSGFIIFMVFFIDVIFCVAMGWIDAWVVLVITMITSGLWTFGTLKSILG